jgi:superfamily II DNA or RNA helicase
MPVTFLDLIRAHAPQHIVARGIRYYAEGRVRDLRVDGEVTRARVLGSRTYETRVEMNGTAIRSSCSCDSFESFDTCKHVVAVLVAIERRRVRGEALTSWRDLASPLPQPIMREEREVRYRVKLSKGANALVVVEALTPRKNGERVVAMRDVPGLRPSDRALVDVISSGVGWWDAHATRVEHHRAALVLPLLAQTGRATVTVDEDEETPLEWDAGPPWQLGLVCESKDGGLEARGELVRGQERVALHAPRVVLGMGLVLLGKSLARVEMPSFAWARALREKSLRVAKADVEDFAEFAANAPVPIAMPAELRYTRVTAKPALVVRVASAARGVSADLAFEYEGKRISDDGPVIDRASKRVWVRNPAAEKAWLESVRAAGFKVKGFEVAITVAKLPRAVRDLVQLGARVEGERGALFRVATRFSSRVSSGIDWLDLEAAAHFDGEAVALPALLAAVRRGDQFVTLGDGSLGMLPEEWLARIGLYGELGVANGDAIRFTRSQAAIVHALLEDLPEVTADAAVEKLRDAMRVRPTEKSPPKAFVGELRGYQREGLGWIAWLEKARLGGCLADDMGLGKTVQVLAHLAGRRTGKPTLVVAPRSVVFNWKNEAARFAPKLRVLEHVGTERDVRAIAKADLVITTYGTLRRDIEELAKVTFDYAILDEAQAIKNRLSISAKAARLLRADNRLALTGTPIENHLHELGSLFSFVEPGLLDGPALERLDDKGASRDALARVLRPFVLRRTKAQVAPELPERVEQTRFVDLDQKARAQYTQLRDHYRKRILGTSSPTGGNDVRMTILEAILRLRQAACHPGLIDHAARGETSAKLDALVADLEEVTSSGHKALVFSQFTSMLSIVRDRLDAANMPYEYLDGQTRDRQERIERFQDDGGPKVFLISLKAGGVGLNLTAAEYVFLLDPWWNPAVEAQAIDRAHRIGQTRTVMAYRIIARDTIEERVLTLQDQKRALFDSLFGEGAASVGALTTEDLDLLLS